MTGSGESPFVTKSAFTPIIHYTLFEFDKVPFVLEIPTEHLLEYSFKPVRWLRYVGWAFLGVPGKLVEVIDRPVYTIRDVGDEEVDLASSDPGLTREYRFEPESPIEWDDENNPIINLESLASISQFDGTDPRRKDFGSEVIIRDGACVLTSQCGDAVQGCHLFQHARGDEWIRLVLRRRHGALTAEITSIDDVRNAVTLSGSIHPWFEKLRAAFLVKESEFGITAPVDYNLYIA